ncbi:MAG: hypothetical protein IKU57_02610 [Oscillospiraceae bacterium]|nr:hypothetical protein [Oscillospiraceae bacterium]
MKTLPKGVYVVHRPFKHMEGDVTFTFRGEEYTATVGVNAFYAFEKLVLNPIEAADSFLGYENTPVVIIPSGICPVGTVGKCNADLFRTYFPRAMVFLGENAGISPNEEDLRTPAERNEESILEGSFYFGKLCIKGELDGAFVFDGLTLRTRLYDERAAGNDVRLVVKNCILDAVFPDENILVPAGFNGHRTVEITDCRCVNMDAMGNEGKLLHIVCGELLIDKLYMADTKKFLGLVNYARTTKNALSAMTVRNCIFENAQSIRGLTLNATEKVDVLLEGCQFLNFVPESDSAVNMTLAEGSTLRVENCHFAGSPYAPAMTLGGDLSGVSMENTTYEGFSGLWEEEQGRRITVNPEKPYPVVDPHAPVEADFAPLDKLYEGRTCYYGDFHCHSNSGGTSDGQTPLADYVPRMKELGMDFAAIVDHKQQRHFFLPEWDEEYLICGTEPGTVLEDGDRPTLQRKLHYTMIFPDKTGFEKVMAQFPQYGFTGGVDGTYQYINPTRAQLCEIAEYVYSIGGLLSHAHPKQLLVSEDPMDYYFSDLVPLETVQGAPESFGTRQNRELWMTLLAMGKRIRTHGSSDSHGPVSNRAMTAVYAEKHHSTNIFNRIRLGDCTAGAVGIQMCLGDTPMGSVTAYAPGKTLLVRVGQFHKAHYKDDTVYSFRLYTDKGLAYAKEFYGEPMEIAFPAEKRMFYRVEIFNESDGHTVALSNPIWLD